MPCIAPLSETLLTFEMLRESNESRFWCALIESSISCQKGSLGLSCGASQISGGTSQCTSSSLGSSAKMGGLTPA